MSTVGSRVVCAGCGHRVSDSEPYSFRCPRADVEPDVDHLLTCEIDLDNCEFPEATDGDNPFIRYRRLMHSWRLAMRHGMTDDQYVAIASELDSAIGHVDGMRCAPTDYCQFGPLDAWAKLELRGVAGSHKARHLIGLAIYLEVVERTGLVSVRGGRPRLAIASCGNAALAAAVVARAAGRQLAVFIPTWADPAVVARLEAHGAELVVCPRRTDDPPGDPCVHRFREAVAAGDIPFGCQGSDNGLTIEGGKTLAWELLAQHRAAGAEPLAHVVVQVGGGALASSLMQGYEIGRRLLAGGGAGPRFWAVQSTGCSPLVRAWQRVRSELDGGRDAVGEARRHRSRYMWPWECEPTSAATGILDDETYDWLAIVAGLAESGGGAVAVDEATLAQARALAREATGLPVDATGAAGLAGLLALRRDGVIAAGEPVAVLLTGGDR